MHDDERLFLRQLYTRNATPRDLILEHGFPMHPKRAWYLLEKWCRKGWYDYGVTLDLGWLTTAGKRSAKELVEEDDTNGSHA